MFGCCFFYIGGIVHHHCLNFLLIKDFTWPHHFTKSLNPWNYFRPSTFYWDGYIKPGKWVFMYCYVKGNDFTPVSMILFLFLWFYSCFYDFIPVSIILPLFLWFYPCFYDFTPVSMILPLFLWFYHCFYDFSIRFWNCSARVVSFSITLLVKIFLYVSIIPVKMISTHTRYGYFYARNRNHSIIYPYITSYKPALSLGFVLAKATKHKKSTIVFWNEKLSIMLSFL